MSKALSESKASGSSHIHNTTNLFQVRLCPSNHLICLSEQAIMVTANLLVSSMPCDQLSERKQR
jgi:hypothetical protein